MAPLAALLVLALLPVPAAKAEELGIGGDQQLVEMSIVGGSISFAPLAAFEELTLTVAGLEYSVTRSFQSGEAPSFAPVDSEGFSLPDGTYNWELSAMPRPEDLNLKEFRNGKISADGREMVAARAPQMQRQSGTFTIADGAMVDPTLKEPEPQRTLGAPMAAAPPSEAARSAERSDQDGNN